MESLFRTASKPHPHSEATSRARLSEALPPWAEDDSGNGIVHGNSATDPKFRDPESRIVHTPARKLDNSRVANQIVLAQRLSHQEKKDLHFIIQRYRLLCTRLVEVANNLRSKVFLITSALAEEGKSLTAANLAFALSGIERKRTLLIDLDLRRFTLHSLLGIASSRSDEIFLEAEDWHDYLWSLRPNLHALLPTRPAEQPDQLIHSTAMQNLLISAREEYDYVLIDSAPLLLAADTHALLPIIDQALLVVRADHTPIACSQDALKILGDKAVGCILNDVKRLKYEAYYHSYYGTDDTP
jgi:capsular exopolysaccharide synthesis family protein